MELKILKEWIEGSPAKPRLDRIVQFRQDHDGYDEQARFRFQNRARSPVINVYGNQCGEDER